MGKVARYAKLVAREGQGARLAGLLIAAGEGLQADPECELYLVNRTVGDPDTLWVTELWRSQAGLDAAVARVRGSAPVAAASGLIAGSDLVELEPLGGKAPGAPGAARAAGARPIDIVP